MSDAEHPRGEASDDIERIEDVQDLKQRRKLKSLLDAEESVREMRKKAKIGEREGTSVGVVGYRAAVEDYLLALRPLIKSKNEDLWTDRRLGSLTIQPPPTRQFFTDVPESEIGGNGVPRFGDVYGLEKLNPRTVAEFEGLGSLLDAESQFSASWTLVYTPAGGGGRRELTEPKRVDLPRRIVDEAYELASDFADDHGFGFKTDSGRPFSDYS